LLQLCLVLLSCLLSVGASLDESKTFQLVFLLLHLLNQRAVFLHDAIFVFRIAVRLLFEGSEAIVELLLSLDESIKRLLDFRHELKLLLPLILVEQLVEVGRVETL